MNDSLGADLVALSLSYSSSSLFSASLAKIAMKHLFERIEYTINLQTNIEKWLIWNSVNWPSGRRDLPLAVI